MKIAVENIGSHGMALDCDPKEHWVQDLLKNSLASENPKKFKGKLHLSRINLQVHLKGQIDFEYLAECDRCLEPFNQSLQIPLDIHLSPSSEIQGEGEDKIELSQDDLNFSSYNGLEIDISELIHDQLILSLPSHPICSESCQGICPHCSQNKNKQACQCEEEKPIDPRWAILKSFSTGK